MMIKAYMSGNLICPKCSYTMLNKSETVTCIMNMDCELFGKEFERPTVILHEIIEEPECDHIVGLRMGGLLLTACVISRSWIPLT